MTGPFAYTVVDWDDDQAGVHQTLGEVAAAKREGRVAAHFPGGGYRVVPRGAYQEAAPPSRDEALAFIRERAADIAAAPNPATTYIRARGCGRCIDSDPEEKQVADYLASAPWAWRDDPDEHWWRTTPEATP